MRATFIESTGFTRWVTEHGFDETYALLQNVLMADPQVGKAMRGCGGVRKIRIGDPKRGKGKRGGARVVYLYVAEARWFFMLDLYGKNEKDDLSAAEKRHLAQLAAELRRAAQAAGQRGKRKP
jgi:hypothetical protein